MILRFGTSNAGKLKEAQARLEPLGIRVEGFTVDVEEIQADTLEDVARHKATSLLAKTTPPFFCEDAGLFVDALRGFPGVYSHYVFSTLGCDGVLRLLRDVPAGRRGARFRAVIGYVDAVRQIHLLGGEARGTIAEAARGSHGFGFDPIFVPEEGDGRTFGELEPAQKGRVSHRGRALDALVAHLRARDKKV